MDAYVATFHTHLAALRSCRALQKAGISQARLAPVPRRLSSSCGTCTMYPSEDPMLGYMDTDLEAIYRRDGDGFQLVHGEAD